MINVPATVSLLASEGLRPLRGPIEPGFWERHGIWLVPALVVGLLGLLLAARFLLRRRRAVPEDPRVLFEAGVAEALRQGREGDLPGAVAGVTAALRRFLDASGLSRAGETTEELLGRLGREPRALPADSVDRLRVVLAEADAAKFSGQAPGEDAVDRLVTAATEVVEAVEGRKEAGT